MSGHSPQMYIKNIVLDGFKCYEKVTVIKNLNKSYNAITGLNGSGKSNIIDGILFALGLDNRKLLRTNSIKELINVNRSDCTVSLTLCNKDKQKSPEEYKDHDELIITRTINTTGKCKFTLNNHVCTTNTINKLCSKININSEKGEFFFIVMQGQITKILNMKSKDIGNLIEETAGTRSFLKEKERALSIIEKKEIKLKEIENTLESRIGPFFSKLKEEREICVMQKNIEKKKNMIIEEKQKLEEIIVQDDISKNIKKLENYLVEYIKDSDELLEIERKIDELRDIESEENTVNLQDLLEDEQNKMEELKKSKDTLKLQCSINEHKELSQMRKTYDLEELKEKESTLMKRLKIKNTGFENENINILEELNKLKRSRMELLYTRDKIFENIQECIGNRYIEHTTEKDKGILSVYSILCDMQKDCDESMKLKGVNIQSGSNNMQHNKQNDDLTKKRFKSTDIDNDKPNTSDTNRCDKLQNEKIELVIKEIETTMKYFESLTKDQSQLNEDKYKLGAMKNRMHYTLHENVYGTVDENITLNDEKYKEAIFTILGGRAKHIIVKDDQTGSELLNTSERRVSVIPLNKIKGKYIENSLLRKVKENNGIHMIDLIQFDYKLKKAMEHVFSGYFVFTDNECAKKACYEHNITCVTLNGNVYDPKGTLTGGKSNFRIDIIKKSDIEYLTNKIRKAEANLCYFQRHKTDYDNICNIHNMLRQLHKLNDELRIVNIKIDSMASYDSSTVDLRNELEEIRKRIIAAINEERVYKDAQQRKMRLEAEIEKLSNIVKEAEIEQEKCTTRICKLQDKLRDLNVKANAKRLSQRQVDGLEPRQRYLIKSTLKLKSAIKRTTQEIHEQRKAEYANTVENGATRDSVFREGTSNDLMASTTAKNNTRTINGENHGTNIDNTDIKYNHKNMSYEFMTILAERKSDLSELGIDYNIFSYPVHELSDEEHKNICSRIIDIKDELDSYKEARVSRIDTTNFDLLEKNEVMINSLKEKVSRLEKDKKDILQSISSFDLLGIKENEKAFIHLNNKIGKFLQYFLKDSDVRIEKNNNYELRVKVGNWKDSLNELSGGQRSLVALCLIFSILIYKPAPFYIFDEIDSALDLNYTESIGEIIKQEFKGSQFIVVSLKNGMYDNANSVFKVFLKDGKSNICQIK